MAAGGGVCAGGRRGPAAPCAGAIDAWGSGTVVTVSSGESLGFGVADSGIWGLKISAKFFQGGGGEAFDPLLGGPKWRPAAQNGRPGAIRGAKWRFGAGGGGAGGLTPKIGVKRSEFGGKISPGGANQNGRKFPNLGGFGWILVKIWIFRVVAASKFAAPGDLLVKRWERAKFGQNRNLG